MQEIFSIPIWKYLSNDFDKEKVLFTIKQYFEKYGTTKVSNHNGLQSDKSLHQEEELHSLFVFICQSVAEASKDLDLKFKNIEIVEAWANINKGTNSYNHQHNHQGVFSGVFYVSAPEGSGNLAIINPGINTLWPGYYMTNNRNKFTSEAITIKPKDGMLILWPSYIPHSVETNYIDVERISISFNIILT